MEKLTETELTIKLLNKETMDVLDFIALLP
jgi:hypothetical protein